jgi:hypothetical protein
VVQNRDQWRAVVSTAMNEMVDISRVAEQLLDPQEGQMPLEEPRS